eukprot:TRINITY_DN7177_c0_g2_i2.p1 TRINITY_DN7177_c0_g2~~TRINITY_DN7177_c0_g2_i2.p1  ORF type:complete len:330 (+),score=78.18 TRINITY_DN7177_c0_g2_i2:65-1054(+)
MCIRDRQSTWVSFAYNNITQLVEEYRSFRFSPAEGFNDDRDPVVALDILNSMTNSDHFRSRVGELEFEKGAGNGKCKDVPVLKDEWVFNNQFCLHGQYDILGIMNVNDYSHPYCFQVNEGNEDDIIARYEPIKGCNPGYYNNMTTYLKNLREYSLSVEKELKELLVSLRNYRNNEKDLYENVTIYWNGWAADMRGNLSQLLNIVVGDTKKEVTGLREGLDCKFLRREVETFRQIFCYSFTVPLSNIIPSLFFLTILSIALAMCVFYSSMFEFEAMKTKKADPMEGIDDVSRANTESLKPHDVFDDEVAGEEEEYDGSNEGRRPAKEKAD